MEQEVKEIYQVLVARPEIKELFKTILSLPKEKQPVAIKMVTDFLQERKEAQA